MQRYDRIKFLATKDMGRHIQHYHVINDHTSIPHHDTFFIKNSERLIGLYYPPHTESENIIVFTDHGFHFYRVPEWYNISYRDVADVQGLNKQPGCLSLNHIDLILRDGNCVELPVFGQSPSNGRGPDGRVHVIMMSDIGYILGFLRRMCDLFAKSAQKVE